MSSKEIIEDPESRCVESDEVDVSEESDEEGQSNRFKEILIFAVYLIVVSIEWVFKEVADFERRWISEKECRRIRRADRLIEGIVRSIFFMPEFSHLVRVRGASDFVLTYLKGNAEETLLHYTGLYEGLRSKLKKVVGGAFVSVVFFLMLGVTVKDEWRANDRDSLSKFPSTAWFGEAFDRLAWPGTVAALMVVSFLILMFVRGLIFEVRSYRGTRLSVKQRATAAILPHLRVALNIWADAHSPTELKFETAPALGAIGDDRYLIERAELERIEILIRELGVSAVAISGPRGAGKSTLLHAMKSDLGWRSGLCLGLDAPASYESRDFVITLYRQLCEHVIDRVSKVVDLRWKRILRSLIAAVRLAVALTALLVAVSQWPPAASLFVSKVDPIVLPRNLWQAVIYVALLGVLYLLFGEMKPFVGLSGATELIKRAKREDERLRYLQAFADEQSGSFKAKFGFELGKKRTRQLLEQPASFPDLVRSYRSFASSAIAWWRECFGPDKKLIVIIDELDRVTDGEAAERFINEIKGIFGIQHCTYLVTVSEDALAQFERRMIGIRPVLDSTFDEVVRLPVLNFSQAKELLVRRLVGFPQSFIALCHALSGGIPRDLIRSARALIDSRRAMNESELDLLAEEVVYQEVRRLKSGLIGRVNNELAGAAAVRLLELLADPEWPARDADGMLAAAKRLIPEEGGELSDRISMELGVALYYYGTILEIFAILNPSLPKNLERLAGWAEKLAIARSVMPASVELAYVHIVRLREEKAFVDFLNVR